jgi:hypothetical protein
MRDSELPPRAPVTRKRAERIGDTAGKRFLETGDRHPQTIARRILECAVFVPPQQPAISFFFVEAYQRPAEPFEFPESAARQPRLSPETNADSIGKPSSSDVTSTTAV